LNVPRSRSAGGLGSAASFWRLRTSGGGGGGGGGMQQQQVRSTHTHSRAYFPGLVEQHFGSGSPLQEGGLDEPQAETKVKKIRNLWIIIRIFLHNYWTKEQYYFQTFKISRCENKKG
jgi:hypothetical protein